MMPKKPPEVKKDFLDLTNLIRSIQRAEGNVDCFRRAEEYCDEMDCSWRRYCLQRAENDPILR
jgi:hypothetical protein